MKKKTESTENPIDANVTSIPSATQQNESGNGSVQDEVKAFTMGLMAALRHEIKKTTPAFLMQHDKYILTMTPAFQATIKRLFAKNIIIKGRECWFDTCTRTDVRFIVLDNKDIWKPSCKYHSNIILKQLRGGFSV